MGRLQEIEQRLSAIAAELEQDGANIDALETEYKSLKEEREQLMDKVEKRNSIIADITKGAGVVNRTFQQPESRKTNITPDMPEYRNAFLKNLQGKPLSTEERAYLDSSAVGAVIPTQTANMIFDKMVKLAPMLDEIQLFRVAGNLKIAVEGTRADAAKHTENASITPASDTLTYIELGGYEYVKIQSISATVQTMAIPEFENWLVVALAEDIARKLEDAIINGDGDGDPKGIDYANTWATGTNGIDYGTALTYDNIIDLIALLPARYDANAKFLMNKAMFYTQIAKIKDLQGNPIIMRDFVNAAQMRILGYPVIISDKVSSNAAYLGDYKKIVGNLSQDINVKSSAESGFTRNAIDFRGACLFDCDIALTDAIVKLFT